MNRKYVVLFAATSLAVGMSAGAYAQNQSADNANTTAQQQSQQLQGTASDRANQAAGAVNAQQSPYADDIRRVLANVTEQAVKGDTKDVADYFTTNSKDQFSSHGKHAADTGPNATADTDQARKDAKAADDQLKQTSKEFADAWKAKYGHSFNLDRKNEPLVYSGDTFQILQGNLSNAAEQSQPHAASGHVGPTGAELDTNRTSANDRSANGATAKAADVDKRMATVMVKESHGAPNVTLTMVNEGTFGNRWHIQPPPGLDYKTLSMNLNHHLQEVVNMKDQWPQDENEAYKLVSHHMLAAIEQPMGQQAAGQSDLNTAQPAGQTQQPADQSSQQPKPSQPSR